MRRLGAFGSTHGTSLMTRHPLVATRPVVGVERSQSTPLRTSLKSSASSFLWMMPLLRKSKRQTATLRPGITQNLYEVCLFWELKFLTSLSNFRGAKSFFLLGNWGLQTITKCLLCSDYS